jgi:hypothetical protein
MKRILNSGDDCYHSVQNLLSSRLLSKNVKIRTHKTTILPVVLYGCETWSLTLRLGANLSSKIALSRNVERPLESCILREEHSLRVFESRVLRRIIGPKGDEVIGGWTKLHNEEFHNLYGSPSIIRIIESRG